MTPERKEQLRQLRKQLASLTESQKAALANRGIITTIEGRNLSLNNTRLVYLQSNGNHPSVVGGYQQWKKAGKQVRRGEHGYTIFVPIGTKQEDDTIVDVTTFFAATVFDISQVQDIGTASPTPANEIIPIKVTTPTPDAGIMANWRVV